MNHNSDSEIDEGLESSEDECCVKTSSRTIGLCRGDFNTYFTYVFDGVHNKKFVYRIIKYSINNTTKKTFDHKTINVRLVRDSDLRVIMKSLINRALRGE